MKKFISQAKMKPQTLIFVILIIISFVRSSTIDNHQTEEGEREEVQEEINKPVVNLNLHSVRLNTCRTGYRLTESGDCRRVLFNRETTAAP